MTQLRVLITLLMTRAPLVVDPNNKGIRVLLGIWANRKLPLGFGV